VDNVGVDDAFSGSRAHIIGRESRYQESPVLFGCCASCRMAPPEMTKMAQRKSTAKKAAAKSSVNRKAAPRKSRTASMLSDLRNDAQALSKRVGRLLERFS
jgi:hypothetical protein